MLYIRSPERFHLLPESLYLGQHLPISLTPPPQATTDLSSGSMNSTFLDSTRK